MEASWIGTIGGVIGLIVALGGVVAYLRGAWDKSTISSLKENNEALDARVMLLEASEIRLKAEAVAAELKHKAEIDALKLRLTTLEEDNAALRAQRPSAEAIEAVFAKLLAVQSDTQKLVKALEGE